MSAFDRLVIASSILCWGSHIREVVRVMLLLMVLMMVLLGSEIRLPVGVVVAWFLFFIPNFAHVDVYCTLFVLLSRCCTKVDNSDFVCSSLHCDRMLAPFLNAVC